MRESLMIKPTNKQLGYYIPTPAQIAAATAKIRAGWSDDEERRRNVYYPREVDVMSVRVRGIEVPSADD
jgi:hypothetical protein